MFDEQIFLSKLEKEFASVVSDVYFSLRKSGFNHKQAIRQMFTMPDILEGPVGLPAHEGNKTFKKKVLLDF